MKLDSFDSHILEQTGTNPQDFFSDNYSLDIKGASNAEKFKSGIMRHLRYKLENATEDNIPVHEKQSIDFRKKGSRFVERLTLLSESDMNNPSSLLTKMGLDPAQWKLLTADFDAKSWQVTMKLYKSAVEEGKRARQPDKVHKETNWGYNCKIKVQPLQDKISVDTMRNVFEGLTIPTPKKYKYASSGTMLEIGMPDIHMGKLAWADQTGEDHYDIKIAGRRSKATIENFLARAGTHEKILFPIGQDFFHIDNTSNETTAGTRMDVDGRWEKLYREGVEFLVWAVAELRRLAPVDIFYVPGNHDKMLSYCAVVTLAQAFAKADGVTVDLAPTPRTYRSFGKCLVGFSHGKEGKRIEKLMQVEQPIMWGKSLWREFHLSDLHHETVWEDGGIIFRRISSITSTDGWHADKGFKGAVRKAQAFEWDKELGLINIQNSVVRE